MMMETIMSRSLRLMFSGGVALGIGMLAQPAFAQDTTTAAPVQRVEITGSSIRRVDAETPSPVQVLSSEDLKKSGFTSVADVLSNITANGQGTLSQGFSGAFAAGASAISLRGLNSSATLVLIDGHRMAPNALADDAQRLFVDTSNIPFDAVERIEILKDGASAIYGSDAMAGVVNVILKKSVVGTTVSGEAGSTTEGGGATKHASITSGFGDLEEDGYNAFAALEYRHQNAISNGQRLGDGGWTTQDFTSQGGNRPLTPGVTPVPGKATPVVTLTPYFYIPGTKTVPFTASSTAFLQGPCSGFAAMIADQCKYINPNSIQPETENINLLTSFTKRLAGDWKLGVKASLFEAKTDVSPRFGATIPSSYAPYVAVSANQVPVPVGVSGTVRFPATYPGNTFGIPVRAAGYAGGPDRQDDVTSKNYRFVADLEGTIGEWDISTAAGWTRNKINESTAGTMDPRAFNAAINRPVNPYLIQGTNSASDIATIFPTLKQTDTSTLYFGDFRANRSLATLAGGDLGISVGAAYSHLDLNSPAADLVAEGLIAGNNAYAVGSQTNTSVFGEFAAPVLKTLELDGALRYDHFDNSSGAATPKVAFKWTPTSAVALRGSYSTGFRAPNPAENGKAGNAYVDVTNTYDAINCPGGPTAIKINGVGVPAANTNNCGVNTILQGATKNLDPEKSKSKTLGVILEPVKGWSTTYDLYQIEISKQIISGTPDFNNPVRAATVTPGQLCNDGLGGTTACNPAPTTPPILYYPAGYINANSTKVSGWELETRYKFNLGDKGSLAAKFDWSHTMSYLLTQPGLPDAQLAGTHGPSVVGGNTANPKDRIQATLTYEKGALAVTTGLDWVGRYDLTDPSIGVNDCQAGQTANTSWFNGDGVNGQNYCKVASFMTTKLVIGYKVSKQLFIHFNMDNVFNRQAPVDLNSYGSQAFPYNPSLHYAGAIGRTFNGGLTYSF
ncbi:TonB-dependent receptor domain-containing protein [Sapientia aquatica]|uniref:TonB-dependent receptor n=1 Tax=Sapientia aquatica TaxID=1549640 RepID=A0A4R5VWX7_9BURK|nr:TonB-dependent receptor [Sapientia aquatica]TDK62805.1 TonB-dependent receptor [Sapientia aquatica]